MKIIKICDVKNIYEARTLGEHEVDFIGLHYISKNDRARQEDIKTIIRLNHQDFPATKSILVTKEDNINELIELVNEFECDGLQLHYEAEPTIFAQLKAHFGSHLILFAVITPDSNLKITVFDYADYVILDQSYTGGTGMKITDEMKLATLQRFRHPRLLLAGGMNIDTVRANINNKEIIGFDIQSSVKTETKGEYENISYDRLIQILQPLGKSLALKRLGQVGLSVSENDKLCDFFGACDFWHFDFFDSVFGMSSDTAAIIAMMERHSMINSHFRFQAHIFSSRPDYITSIIKSLHTLKLKKLEIYIHHNKETVYSFELDDPLYASLDVKDIVSGDFPLKKPLSREKIILCLQSEHHIERNMNANTAMKLIRDLWGKNVDVTLDRGIFPGDMNYVLDQPVDIVSGRYLRERKKGGYNELRRSLKNVR